MHRSSFHCVTAVSVIGVLAFAALISGFGIGSLSDGSPYGHGQERLAPTSIGDGNLLASAGPSISAAPDSSPINPASCVQGTHTVTVAPLGIGRNESSTFISDYDTLGAEGGGTLHLLPGYYQFNQTLRLDTYNNISIQGAGMARTILTVPPNPIANFYSDTGVHVGWFDFTGETPPSWIPNPNGPNVNFIIVGPNPTKNFKMCDLGIDAQVTNVSETWGGSTVFDNGGGTGHVYTDIAEVGFWGPSGSPNGIHIDGYIHPSYGALVDGLYSNNYTAGYASYDGVSRGGPDFLDTGDVSDCTIENVTGTGNFEIEVAPDPACTFKNINVTGHWLIDPYSGQTNSAYGLPAGSWDGATFTNVSDHTNGTVAPNAISIEVANGTGEGGSDFSNMTWSHCHFWGTVVNLENMVNVQNCTFSGTIHSTAAVFSDNVVNWDTSIPSAVLAALPISVDGTPTGGSSAIISGDTFVFPNGTGKRDPFSLTVPVEHWSNDTVVVGSKTSGYVFNAANLLLSGTSSFSQLAYEPLGIEAPPTLELFDIVGSPGFQDLGALIGSLSGIHNNLPLFIPSAPTNLTGREGGPTRVDLTWDASSGPVTNYIVYVGENATYFALSYSAGTHTEYQIEGLAPGTEYYFAVEAWNCSFYSAITSPIEVTTPPLPGSAPSVPSGLTMVSRGVSDIGLEWNPSTGNVTNYTLYTGTNASQLSEGWSVGVFNAFTVTGLSPSTTYYFAVQAWNYSFNSSVTSTIEVTTLPLSGYAPSVPSGLAVVSRGVSDIGLEWNPSTGNVTNYTLYTGTNASQLTEGWSVGAFNAFTVTGLNPSTTYYFAVQAWNGSSPSEPSTSINATTAPVGTTPNQPFSPAVSMSPLDWALVAGTLFAALLVVVGPLVLVGCWRAARRSKQRSRSSR